jgi:hypothetical protein
VSQATSSTSLSSSLNPSAVGASVTFTASVTGFNPGGTVNFTDGAASIAGCGSVALTGSTNTRTASCTTSALIAGTHSVKGTYSGDASNQGSSSASLSQTVNGAGSSTGIATSLTPSVVGNSVTFTATVSGASPTGTVNFKDGSTSIASCSAAVVSGSGNVRTASCATSGLAAGSHSVSAVYSGDASNGTSSSPSLAQAVNKASASTSLSSSANPSALGASVTFTASITGFNPGGTVNFTDGAATITGCGAVALSGSGNTRTAQCTTSGLTAGTHSIKAAYAGDANNASSTSSTLSQGVNASAPPASLVNGGFEIPALAAGTYQYNPAGSGIGWTFSPNSGVQRNGSAWGASSAPEGVQTAYVQSTGTISQTLTLAAGTYTLAFKAAQRACCVAPNVQPVKVTVDGAQIGSLVSPASTSFAPFSIVFNVASSGSHTLGFTGTDASDKTTFLDAVVLSPGNVVPAGTALKSSANPSKRNVSVTFTATVTGSSPTGNVAFTSNGATIAGCAAVALSGSGNSATALCTTTFAKPGTFSIVAHYGGDAKNSLANSAPLGQVVKRR